MRVCHSAPPVSHLCFVDDCLLYFKASFIEIANIKEALNIYERALDNKLIKQNLGVGDMDCNGKYLGLPFIIGRNKKDIFSSIKNKNLEEDLWVEGQDACS
ncbi:hypothetical protein IHE45_05G093500 [Dioscorea alata]|uniref:Uncharacterized protein n=1 Tax=Dioscorea alata TaxID=55571 RepID=A0ACB7W3Q2_DIOAL|nr:hypothetical protein IHE45_05G093500 [Dioscorea alata]